MTEIYNGDKGSLKPINFSSSDLESVQLTPDQVLEVGIKFQRTEELSVNELCVNPRNVNSQKVESILAILRSGLGQVLPVLISVHLNERGFLTRTVLAGHETVYALQKVQSSTGKATKAICAVIYNASEIELQMIVDLLDKQPTVVNGTATQQTRRSVETDAVALPAITSEEEPANSAWYNENLLQLEEVVPSCAAPIIISSIASEPIQKTQSENDKKILPMLVKK